MSNVITTSTQQIRDEFLRVDRMSHKVLCIDVRADGQRHQCHTVLGERRTSCKPIAAQHARHFTISCRTITLSGRDATRRGGRGRHCLVGGPVPSLRQARPASLLRLSSQFQITNGFQDWKYNQYFRTQTYKHCQVSSDGPLSLILRHDSLTSCTISPNIASLRENTTFSTPKQLFYF